MNSTDFIIENGVLELGEEMKSSRMVCRTSTPSPSSRSICCEAQRNKDRLY